MSPRSSAPSYRAHTSRATSNLPTGGFIASSGLESYVQHGLLSSDNSANKTQGVLSFIKKSIHSYARLNLPFVSAVHTAVFSLALSSSPPPSIHDVLARIIALDDQFESMVLNHIARRASTAQGVALLTLYERAFAPEDEGVGAAKVLVERLRAGIRKGEVHGHLSIGFAVLTAALGMSLCAFSHVLSRAR